MARGDATYGNTNVDWPFDPRIIALKSDSCRWFNHVLWLTAVKERREVLPIQYSYGFFAAMLGKKKANIVKWVAEMESQKLIQIMPDNRIRIIGVRDCHKKLKWKDAPYGETEFPIGEGKRVERREKREESHSDDNNSISDLEPVENQTTMIDPDFVQMSENCNDEHSKRLALIVETLQKHNFKELSGDNWKFLAVMLNDGADIEKIEKAVKNHIIRGRGTDDKFKGRFKNQFPNIQSIVVEAERSNLTLQTKPGPLYDETIGQEEPVGVDIDTGKMVLEAIAKRKQAKNDKK